jgi:aconitase B
MFRRRLGRWVRYRNMENEEVMEANTNTYLAVKNNLGRGSSRQSHQNRMWWWWGGGGWRNG